MDLSMLLSRLNLALLGPFSWVLVFVGVILVLRALRLRGCLSLLLWPLVGAAIIGVVWLYAHGYIRW